MRMTIAAGLACLALGLAVKADAAPTNFSPCFKAHGKARPEREIADCTRWIERGRLKPVNLEAAYYDRGRAYHLSGDYDRAIADYDQALRLEPRDAAVWFNRGLAHYAKGDNDAAIRDYDAAIRLDPQDAEAWANRGVAHFARRDTASALADYDMAISLSPQLTLAYVNRGRAYASRGDWRSAVANYDLAIWSNGKFPDAYLERARAYAAEGDYARAGADAERYARLTRGRGEADALRAEIAAARSGKTASSEVHEASATWLLQRQ